MQGKTRLSALPGALFFGASRRAPKTEDKRLKNNNVSGSRRARGQRILSGRRKRLIKQRAITILPSALLALFFLGVTALICTKIPDPAARTATSVTVALLYIPACAALTVLTSALKAHRSFILDRSDKATDTAVLDALPPRAVVVSTTGKTSRELFELRERRGEGHGRDFLTVGSMGHTLSIACGMAAGTDRPVYCIDGDGSFLMHMGSAAVFGQHAPDNLRYLLINNGAHESVGGQPTDALAVNVPEILSACGFSVVEPARTAEEIAAGLAAIAGKPRGALMLLTRVGSRADLGRPTTTPVENKRALMATFGVGED